jgi:DNA helicase-2/ATP-dependent DNA helicase PcrA
MSIPLTTPPAQPRAVPAGAGAPLAAGDQARLDTQALLFERARAHLPRDPFPHYLAHLRLSSEGVQRDVLFIHGPQPDRSPEPDLVIANWQSSRFSELLFGCKEGDRYELATALGRSTGQVLEQNLAGFRDAELVHLITPQQRLSLTEDGSWERWPRAGPLLEPRSAEAQAKMPSLIDVSLDPAQRAAVELPTERSVLVLGEAGHGKTTVALHRLARLYKAASGPFRAAVIVPTDGLRRLIEPLLRDPALRLALRTLAEPRRTRGAPPPGPKRAARARKALARRRDLLHLFGDRSLVARVMANSVQPLGAHVLSEVLEHARVQFSRTTEQEFAHVVDKQRLRAIDGRPLDEGTPLQDAGSIDTEDYAVLFELDRLKAEQRGRVAVVPPLYDCILLDEAQELAPLELALIGRSLAPTGSLIVAGDADQQTDPTVCFTSWEQSMQELGCSEYDRVVLPVSYRCPPQVVSIARGLIGGTAPAPETPAPFVQALNECHLASWLIDELAQLTRRDPTASVAVICRVPSTARRLQAALRERNLGRLVLDGEFLFRSGVNVTELDQVKGLEFDYVIVPDASAATYPDTPEAHRALYVAVTRTRHQLLLGAVAGQTPLLSLPAILP